MDLELNRTELSGFDTAASTTLFSEETLECIVPDACPDVLRILDTGGLVCVKSKEAGEGRVELRGVIRASVLYLPDGEEGVRKVEVSIPFTCSSDVPGAHSGSPMTISPRLLSADARLLNPRKLYLRAELAIGLEVFVPNATLYSMGGQQHKEFGVEQRLESCQAYFVTSIQEKPFTFSDDLPLPGSKPDLDEILQQELTLLCAESKVIGNKLIFKGQVELTLLYRGTDLTLNTTSFELPFSQIMEVSEGGEEADCDLDLYLTDFSCQADGEDHRLITVSVGVLAQAVLREERRMELVSDLYSTLYSVECEEQEDVFHHLSERGVRRQPVRTVLEVPVGVKSVLDCRLAIGMVSQSWSGASLTLSADVRAVILYLGEDDSLYTIARPVSAECQLELEPDCQCPCHCICPGELFATPTSEGIEVRFPLDFYYRSETRRTVREISSAKLNQEDPLDGSKRPSIVLRRLEAGEALWDIAKGYHTTIRDIMGANELSEENVPAGRLLLIPKKR